MKFTDKHLSLLDFEILEDYMKKYKVSETARSKGNIVDQVRQYGSVDKLPDEWKKSRKLFLIRSIPAYVKNPTFRRWLSLKVWFYDQETLDQISKSLLDAVKPHDKDLGEPSS